MTKTMTTPNFIQIATLAICSIIFILCILMTCGYGDTHYTTTAIVSTVDDSGTTFVDGAGYVWAVYDTCYEKGQFVELKFYNNTTDYTREDDEIVKVKILDN